MLVYRIEHPEDGLGPYRSEFSNSYKLLRMNAKHSSSPVSHPHSSIDSYNKPWPAVNPSGFCAHGFIDIESLKFWFKGYRKELTREGFKMFVYDSNVDSTWVSNKTGQVIFIKENTDLLFIREIP